jgi:AcrR family transcriptional regulator
MSSDSHETRGEERRVRAAERRARAAERRAEQRERGRARSEARRRLDADAIVQTALRIADRDGVDAVSMRNIASELGVGTMSLYHHVADKDELLERMADAIAGELVIPGGIPADWRAALRAIAHRTRAAFMRHPWLIETAGQRPLLTPNQLRHIEQSITVVADLDVDRETAIAMVMATDDYTIGHVFRRARFGDGPRPDVSPDEQARMRELLASGEYPRLAEVYGQGGDLAPPPDTFELGLEWLFDGIQAALDARG